MSEAIEVEQRANAIIVRFVRPEIRNPLSVEVVKELQRLLDDIAPWVERVIFTGAGNVFASGADLREIAEISAEDSREFALRGQQLMNTVAGCKAQTVAAVNGFCFGGALDLAVSCDHRIAAAAAEFSHPGTSLGIITGWSGTQRLPRLIGQGRALEMFLTAARFSARQAFEFGLIDQVAEDAVAAALEIS
ncbi:MAG: enoyl-CoA hydratase/isomerase family protein [Pyrinomonadaceae bacterium]